MSRQDQYSIHVYIDGDDYGIWDKLSGGTINSEETKYRPGAMGPQISLGGQKTVENITVSRLWRQDRDLAQLKALIEMCGRAPVSVSKQPLDLDGNQFGDPLVYTGKLKSVNPPDADSSATDAALIELEISTSGTVA